MGTASGGGCNTEDAAAMSAANEGWLSFSYTAETECEVFHRPSVTSVKTGESFQTVDRLLRCVYPKDALHAPRYRSIKQDTLLRKVVDEDPETDGFVTVVGGVCDYFDDKVGTQFSFCYQRAKPRSCELGSFTRQQILESCGGDQVMADKKLKKILDTPVTLAKHYYENHGELIGVPLLRWLIKERGFRAFQIRHYIHFNCRDYFAPYLSRLLQLRHDIKRGNFSEGGFLKLAEACIKLLNNGLARIDFKLSHYLIFSLPPQVLRYRGTRSHFLLQDQHPQCQDGGGQEGKVQEGCGSVPAWRQTEAASQA